MRFHVLAAAMLLALAPLAAPAPAQASFCAHNTNRAFAWDAGSGSFVQTAQFGSPPVITVSGGNCAAA